MDLDLLGGSDRQLKILQRVPAVDLAKRLQPVVPVLGQPRDHELALALAIAA